MYYPQDTTLQMGPTALTPSTQYCAMSRPNDRKRAKMPEEWINKQSTDNNNSNSEDGLPMVCEAGTVVLIHYDIWHRGMGNNSNVNRYMFKFQFIRYPLYIV